MHGAHRFVCHQAAADRAAADRERQKKFKGESKASDEVRVFLRGTARPSSTSSTWAL
jgi:hypothetical protein